MDDIFFVGSIRKKKLKKYQYLFKDIPKKTFEYCYKNNDGKKSILTKNNDSKIIYIISNFIDAPKNIKRRGWNKKEKSFMKKNFQIRYIFILD